MLLPFLPCFIAFDVILWTERNMCIDEDEITKTTIKHAKNGLEARESSNQNIHIWKECSNNNNNNNRQASSRRDSKYGIKLNWMKDVNKVMKYHLLVVWIRNLTTRNALFVHKKHFFAMRHQQTDINFVKSIRWCKQCVDLLMDFMFLSHRLVARHLLIKVSNLNYFHNCVCVCF